MRIRTMTSTDYDAVYRLWTGTPGMGMRSLDDSREGIEKFLNRNPGISFVAEADGNIIGVVLCGQDGRRGYLYHVAVDSKFRGQGVGKSLVEAATDALSGEGINRVSLVVYKENETGNGFWDALGFEKRTDLYYRNKSLNHKNM